MSPACREMLRLVDVYLDGELSPAQLVEVESHAASCPACAERIALDRAVRVEVRRSTAAAKPSDAFRARLAASTAAASRGQDARSGDIRPLPLRHGLSLAAAAAMVLVSAGVLNQRLRDGARADERAQAVAAASATTSLDLDRMIDQFVDWHRNPLPPEITNEADLTGFEPYVGVPVHPPVLKTYGARLLGGRILQAHEQVRATAMLQYSIQGGHRVSVYVYDPSRVRVDASRLHVMAVGGRPQMYVGNVRGYSVAAPATSAVRQVGYAVASDLDEDATAELALAAAP